MADAANQKKGLTKFGWVVLGGLAAYFLSKKERRDQVVTTAKDLAGKFTPKADSDKPAS